MKSIIAKIVLSITSILFSFISLEIGARIYKDEFNFHNFLSLSKDLFRSAYPSKFDEELGWIPKEGYHPQNIWDTKVTILDDGIRSNENAGYAGDEEVILAVGDSFTFGDQVSNNETWPAILENISGMKVINGGVFGYGVDQSYLRMQKLIPKYKPDYIIFSFIPDDIYRCELSERTSAQKPYFELSENNSLVLIKDHLPSHRPPEKSLDIFRKTMGYSFLIHKLASRWIPQYWLQGSWEKSTKIHSNGPEVTCSIFKKLKYYAQKEKIKIYVLIQYRKDEFRGNFGILNKAISCIDENIITIIDLHNSLAELKKHNTHEYNSLFQGHMTKKGNQFVASNLWEIISMERETPNKTMHPINDK